MSSAVFSDRRQGIPFENRRQGLLFKERGQGSPFEERRQGLPDRRMPGVNGDLRGVADGIHREFDGRLDRRVVDECLSRVGAKFDDAKVRSFVPLLVRRYVRDELGDSPANP
ncbi:MAG TPA: hypothetical protein VES02_02505 [Dermatophilaceae bacterium]|nr:hypothetical protein [Dermatophilaceae bacterium]